MHPKARTHCGEVNLRPADAVLELRHNQKAGSAKSSQARLSRSSMKQKAGSADMTPR